MLGNNSEKVRWDWLSFNRNAIYLLEINQDKIHWDWLSCNRYAMHLLEKNPEKICWSFLSTNLSIFADSINYKFLKERMDVIREELMMKSMHPARMERWLEMGGEIDDF